MFVPEKLKVNKMVQLDLPKPKDFVTVNGKSAFKEMADSAYTGENSVDNGDTKLNNLVKVSRRMNAAVKQHEEKLNAAE